MNKKLSKKRFQRIILECVNCKEESEKYNKRSFGISRYYTLKLRTNAIKRIARPKHCKYCNKHTLHQEI